jgi:hypothetical protein
LFAVRTPTALVEDLGTEFGVEVAEGGETASHVFQGQVRVMVAGAGDVGRGTGDENENPKSQNPNQQILLSAGQSARVVPGENASVLRIDRPSVATPEYVRQLPRSIVLAWFRLGEDDPDAKAGTPANRETREHRGRCRLEKRGNPRYGDDAAPRAGTLSMRFSGAEGECFTATNVHCAVRDNFVLEAWVKVNRLFDRSQLIVHNGHSDRNGFGIIVKDGRWQGMLGGIRFVDSGVDCRPGQWVHLALVCQRGTTQMWIDGRPVGEPSRGWPVVPDGMFLVGGNPENPMDAFDGAVDEVRLSAFVGQMQPKTLLFHQAEHSQEASKVSPIGE